MLSKVKSKQAYLLKYTLLIPMVASMLIYTSCNDSKSEDQRSIKIEQTVAATALKEKIKAIKKQIEIQGNVSEKEEQGIDLLLKTITGTSLDTNLIEDVQTYTSMQNKTPLTEKIADVLEQIQVQGNISNDEEKALKGLLLLITKDGFNNPIF